MAPLVFVTFRNSISEKGDLIILVTLLGPPQNEEALQYIQGVPLKLPQLEIQFWTFSFNFRAKKIEIEKLILDIKNFFPLRN